MKPLPSEPAMKNTIHAKYDEADEVAGLLSESGSVKYSKTAGFFIERCIYQKRSGRTWETLDEEDFDEEVHAITGNWRCRKEAIETGRVRILQTFRAISRDQAIRRFLDGYDDHGGMMTVIAEALDKAGIEPLEETI